MSSIVDEYSQRIRSQETTDKLGLTSYNKAFQTTIQKAATVALTDVPILICGESGTGKNAMARYLHQCSSRREKPFIVVNCAAVPADMIEGVLFGDGERQGKLVVAEGGTLFLDEIEELPLPAQSRLLYFLQQDGMDSSGGGETFYGGCEADCCGRTAAGVDGTGKAVSQRAVFPTKYNYSVSSAAAGAS